MSKITNNIVFDASLAFLPCQIFTFSTQFTLKFVDITISFDHTAITVYNYALWNDYILVPYD